MDLSIEKICIHFYGTYQNLLLQNHGKQALISFCQHQSWTISSYSSRQKLFTSPIERLPRDFKIDHPFRIFGKKILSTVANLLHKNERLFLETNVKSVGSGYYIPARLDTREPINSLILEQSGAYHIVLSDLESAPLTFEDKPIQQFTYVHPFALSVVKQAEYFQLDASFAATYPYVYSIPLAIIANESFPLGLQLSPTEREQHYTTFFDTIQSIAGDDNLFQGKHFLSDEGKGVKAFVQKVGGIHHFCYRHILEKIGSNSEAAEIAKGLLFSSSPEEFLTKLPQALMDFHELALNDSLNSKQIQQLSSLFDFNWDSDSKIFLTKDDATVFAQSLWTRAQYGISTCSNHVERIHRTCNTILSSTRSPLRRIGKVIKILSKRFEMANQFLHRQAKEKFSFLFKRATEYNLPALHVCPHSYCLWSFVYSKRFGIKLFPCLHTARTAAIDQLTFRKPVLERFTTGNPLQQSYNNDEWNFKGNNQNELQLQEQEQESSTSININDDNDDKPDVNDALENIVEDIPDISQTEANFLMQISRELISNNHLPEESFLTTLIDVTKSWTRYIAGKENTASDLKTRSEFKHQLRINGNQD
jgi:hypothetical protein